MCYPTRRPACHASRGGHRSGSWRRLETLPSNNNANIVQHSTAQNSTVQYSTAQHRIVKSDDMGQSGFERMPCLCAYTTIRGHLNHRHGGISLAPDLAYSHKELIMPQSIQLIMRLRQRLFMYLIVVVEGRIAAQQYVCDDTHAPHINRRIVFPVECVTPMHVLK